MKIAILGSHSESRMRAPFKDPSWAIWACSPGNMHVLPRVDAWFEMHIPVQSETRPDDYIEYLRTLPLVFLRDEDAARDLIPGAALYPDADMKRRFGRFFFTSSIAYLLAYAIAGKPTHIGLWGVHMASREEYKDQRPGCQYFIQRAWDQGIEITVPPESRLLEPPKDNW